MDRQGGEEEKERETNICRVGDSLNTVAFCFLALHSSSSHLHRQTDDDPPPPLHAHVLLGRLFTEGREFL